MCHYISWITKWSYLKVTRDDSSSRGGEDDVKDGGEKLRETVSELIT